MDPDVPPLVASGNIYEKTVKPIIIQILGVISVLEKIVSCTDSDTTSTPNSDTDTDTDADTDVDSDSDDTIWSLPPGATWQWQLTGTLDTSLDVRIYDIDLFDNSAATISAPYADDRIVICYFTAGFYEHWRDDMPDWISDIDV